MDRLLALEFVEIFEAHRKEEEEIWQGMRERSDYKLNEDRDIETILALRAKARRLEDEADAALAGFGDLKDAPA